MTGAKWECLDNRSASWTCDNYTTSVSSPQGLSCQNKHDMQCIFRKTDALSRVVGSTTHRMTSQSRKENVA